MPLLMDPGERLARPDLQNLARLRVLTTVDFPPFSFVDQTGRLSGFHVDLVREICAELAIEPKCQIQAMPFADIEKALLEGTGEAAVAGIAVTAPLRENFAFSRPYLSIPARFAVRRTLDISGKAAEALATRPVGVLAGTAHDQMLAAFFPALRRVAYDSQESMLSALKQGEVDAVFSDALRLPFWVASADSEACCRLFDGPYLSQRFLGEGLTIMTRKESGLLPAAMDYALNQLIRKGRLQDIYLRYFPNGFY
ncbi:transporter substrate-binding domain-containing protein [Rhizobium sp. FY34]|uniref:transporter substrate-binding domain-containing protein n=1 Tax=Rhizobium sp. FY34 TaxID=2562309 RepID=UPI001FF00000|nr:transporter substrate-binding domain-containing protein [Rhizobium sp. FY34]